MGLLLRSAGSFAQLNARDGKYAIVKLPSGEIRMILITCIATIGSVSNSRTSVFKFLVKQEEQDG